MTLASNYMQLRHFVTSPFVRLEAVTAVSVCSRHGCQEIGDCGSRDQLGDGDRHGIGVSHLQQQVGDTPGLGRHHLVNWTFIHLFKRKKVNGMFL